MTEQPPAQSEWDKIRYSGPRIESAQSVEDEARRLARPGQSVFWERDELKRRLAKAEQERDEYKVALAEAIRRLRTGETGP